MMDIVIFLLVIVTVSGGRINHEGDQGTCDLPSDDYRFDCAPETNSTQATCLNRGCCWKPPILDKSKGVPYCYFPGNSMGYRVTRIKQTDYGYTAQMSMARKSGWPEDVANLQLDVYMHEMYLRFKIYDPHEQRYEVPLSTPPPLKQKPRSTDYQVKILKDPFALIITRISTNTILFDSSVAPLIFADQFIQISTHLNTGLLYGLGEHKDNLLIKSNIWSRRAFWTHGEPPKAGNNLYGSHPFYVEFDKHGHAHGALMLNSNAMEVDLQPLPALTFRTIGGIIDLSIFVGPSPDDVIQQYSSVIGRPTMPPYWALGFHLCRWGYKNVQHLKTVIDRNRAIGIPYDVQWTDIDYMEDKRDWTYNNVSYKGLPDIVTDLHNHGQKYMAILDPGISSTQPAGTYPPYDEGVKHDIFIKNATGDILIGKVWPGFTAFPDFSNPVALDWWYNMAKDFHTTLAFDGLWTDMNEPISFIYGSVNNCTTNKYDNPPYMPHIVGSSLYDKSICPSAKQHLSLHYNLHSLYGHFETMATHRALEKIMGKRSFVLSRSTFIGTGVYSGHWTGDNSATWDDMRSSITAILNFQMFGIPLMGADICGFFGVTTEQLCIRWMQLGAFYPFMRNHNSAGLPDQDPAAFRPTAQTIMKEALYLRYSILPYLYSMIYATHLTGRPHVARPLAFQYPTDKVTYGIDEQFMLGSSLLVSPALYENQTEVHGYFPADIWYDAYTSETITGPVWKSLPAPLNMTNLHIRGGSIFVTQKPDVTTAKARKNPFTVVVALDSSGDARSDVPLYWDDGETIDAFSKNMVTTVWFSASNCTLSSTPHVHYNPPEGMPLQSVHIVGVLSCPASVTVNGENAKFVCTPQRKLTIDTNGTDLSNPLEVLWK